MHKKLKLGNCKRIIKTVNTLDKLISLTEQQREHFLNHGCFCMDIQKKIDYYKDIINQDDYIKWLDWKRSN